MRYNIRKVGYKGKGALFAYVRERLGLLACAALFCLFGIYSDGKIAKIKYVGDAEVHRASIERSLAEEGVLVGKDFPSDLNALSAKLVLKNDSLSFASVAKNGRTLVVEAYGVVGKTLPISTAKERILSPIDGVARRISAYSGTALVFEGDKVKKGDVLIDGYYEKNGEKIRCECLGEVEIIATEIVFVKTFGEGDKYAEAALSAAKEKFSEFEILNSTVELVGEKNYKATIEYVARVSSFP